MKTIAIDATSRVRTESIIIYAGEEVVWEGLYLDTSIARIFKKLLTQRAFTKRTMSEIRFNLNRFFEYLENEKLVYAPQQITLEHVTEYAQSTIQGFPPDVTLDTYLIINGYLNALTVFCCVMFGAGYLRDDYSRQINCIPLPEKLF